MTDRSEFLYPHSRYRGQWSPADLAFNNHLQEFALRVAYISNLETNGKLSPADAYQQIRRLWKQLKRSKKQLQMDQLESSE